MSTAFHTLKIGDTVTWCHSSSRGRNIGFTTKRGKITNLDEKFAWARCKGKTTCLPISRFRPEGVMTDLTQMVTEDAKGVAE